jgi:hypothetical protein
MAEAFSTEKKQRARGTIFGIPLDGLGWFQSLLMATALGFAAFFASCFVAIFAILFLNAGGHRNINFAISYREIALPVGVAVLALSYLTLGFFWVRRRLRS